MCLKRREFKIEKKIDENLIGNSVKINIFKLNYFARLDKFQDIKETW